MKSPPYLLFYVVPVKSKALATQPMLQCRPNRMELRLIILISKFYVESKNVSKKFLHCCSLVMKNHPLLPPPLNDQSDHSDDEFSLKEPASIKIMYIQVISLYKQFLEELFAYIFGIYIRFGYKNLSILTPCNSLQHRLSDQ